MARRGNGKAQKISHSLSARRNCGRKSSRYTKRTPSIFTAAAACLLLSKNAREVSSTRAPASRQASCIPLKPAV